MQAIFGMGLFQPPSLDSGHIAVRTETLAVAASIDEEGTILDRGPLGSIHCEIVIQRHDYEKGAAGF